MTQLRWRELADWGRLDAEEIDQELRDASGFFVLEPVRGVGEGEEIGARAIAQTFVSHFGQEEIVALAPKDPGRDADGFVLQFDANAK
jgi:hypothetical protein